MTGPYLLPPGCVTITAHSAYSAIANYIAQNVSIVWSSRQPDVVTVMFPLDPAIPNDDVPDIIVNVSLMSNCTKNHVALLAQLLLVGRPVPSVVFPPNSIAVLASIAAVGQVNRLELALVLIVCSVEFDQPLTYYNSPLGLSVGSSPLRYYAGSVWGNILVVVAPCVLQLLLVWILRRFGKLEMIRALAFARFPSLLVFPLLFVQQPLVTSSFTLFVWGQTNEDYAAGVAGCIFSVVCYASSLVMLRKKVFGVLYNPNDSTRTSSMPFLGVISNFVYGKGKWNNIDPATEFKQRFNFLFTDYTSSCHWFILVEMAMNIICGAIQGLVQPSFCKSLLFAICVAFLFFAIMAVALRPYSSPVYAILSVGMIILQLIGSCAALAAVYYKNAAVLDTANSTALYATYLLLVQATVGLWPKYRHIQQLIKYLLSVCNPASSSAAVVVCAADGAAGSFALGEGSVELISLSRAEVMSLRRSDRDSVLFQPPNAGDDEGLEMLMLMLSEAAGADVKSASSGHGSGGRSGTLDAEAVVRSPMSFSASFAGLAPTGFAGAASIIANLALSGEMPANDLSAAAGGFLRLEQPSWILMRSSPTASTPQHRDAQHKRDGSQASHQSPFEL